MARVDFYLCQEGNLSRAMDISCRLCEKAFRSGLGIHVQCADESQTQAMDQLLWSFSSTSFLPHSPHDGTCLIEINATPQRPCKLLVNLAGEWLPQAQQYQRVAEVVTSDAAAVDDARQRYRQYRKLGWELNNHKV